jgi:tetratricopeptide (TPR) repeat protein
LKVTGKIFYLIAPAVVIFLTGCETVSTLKHDPVPASEVFLYETRGDFLALPVPNSRNVLATMSPVRMITQHSQYLGKVYWSGVLPELYVPESLYNDDGLATIYNQPEVQDVPERMKTEMKERTGAMGANLVVFDRWLCNYRWVMQDGKFQPTYLFYGKAYWNDEVATFAITNKIGLQPSDYYTRGCAEQVKGDLDDAIADMTKAIELKPDFVVAYVGRGLVKGHKGDFDGAIADFTKTIELKPDAILAYVNRSVAKRMKGDLDGAIADYSKVIELKPDDVSAYDNRGKLKLDMGNLNDAIVDFNEAIKLKPAFDSAYGDRAVAKTVKGDLEGAMADYNTAIKINPQNGWAYHRRGCLYYDSHDFANARVDFGRSIEWESPGQNFSFFRIWLIRAQSGEAEAATGELREYWNFRKIETGDDWQSKISNFLTGQLNEADLFKAARGGEQPCAAYFYAGSKRLIDGDKATAADYFRKCVATGEKTLCEYDSAAAELKFLKETN